MRQTLNSFSPARLRDAAYALVIATLALAAVPATSGQEPEQEADSSSSSRPYDADFGETINIKVINVPAYVTDKKGNPVRGLSKDDFILLEDGQPVSLTNFYEVSEGERLGEDGRSAPRPDPLRAAEPELIRRQPRVPDDERLYLVVYVDHFNIRPFNRNRIFRYVREFLREHVDRDDEVMLVSYNRSVKIERTFTRDAQLISRALFELETHTGGRTNYDSDRRDLLRQMMDDEDPLRVQGLIRLHAEQIYNDMQFTLDGLKEIVGSLGGLPGRKAVLYVSDGLPHRAGDDMFQAMAERFRDDFGSVRLDSLQFDSTRRLRDITDTANANNVAFYTMDATGLMGRTSLGAEYQASFTSPHIDSIANQNMQSTIQMMADETGGQFIVNTNNFDDGFDRFGSDFNNYYSLGFSPSHAGSGRRYKLECKVKVRGLRCRTKQNYRDKSIETEMADTTLAALRFGYERNPLGITLAKTDEIASDDGLYTVHLDARIPLDNIVLLPTSDGKMYYSRVRAWVQAADSKGGLSDVGSTMIPIEVRAEDIDAIEGTHWTYTMPLRVRAGDQRISISIRDDLAGTSSVLSRVVTAGSS